jgi:hypothetical protein
MPPPPPPGPKRSESRRSVQFPGPPPPPPRSSSTDPTLNTINDIPSVAIADDAEPRPRYHSGLTRPTVPTPEPTRSKSFTGKLQSLRKKIENELSRKRGPANGQSQSQSQSAQQGAKKGKKALKGTVAGLRPSPALTVPESMTVADASQLCAAKRTDCVLVVDEEEGLSGIFTAKDLAFRVSPLSIMRKGC